MANVNLCVFVGRVGRAPELKDAGETKVCKFTLAVNDRLKGGEEHVEWVNCATFGRLADLAASSLHKGSLIFVRGKLRTRKYQDKSGADKYFTELLVDALDFMESKGGSRTDDADAGF